MENQEQKFWHSIEINDVLKEFNSDSHKGLKESEILERQQKYGKNVIISFPNFAHISLRFNLFFGGRAPVTKCLPSKWNETPNIRFLSIKDFEVFCKDNNYKIVEKSFITNSKYCHILPNLFAQQAIFVITK